ncbi:zinc finger protein [Macleaya cordata]|uniref:Zinc finger protein n=1 Tax=Macleaya cordata TaxID=56857 RepID=A0A200QRY4_MACCD|nr:zinc finger protein [Macleaya cordata]
MGLSSKQVSGDGRHWTKGGTLRNVPVGGGRKNKRLKTTNTTNNKKKNSINSIKKSESRNSNFTTQQQQEQIKVSSGGDRQKNISEFLYQSLINPTSFTQPDFVNIQENSFVGSTDLSSSQIPSFQFTSLSNFENHPSSISSSFSTGCFQSSSNVFNQSGESEQSVENITNMNPTTTLMQMPGQVPNSTSNFMDSSINWSWEDINTFISTDLKQPWEDDQIKQ